MKRWAYRFSPKVSSELYKSQQDHSSQLQARSWEVQKRLCGRFRQLRTRGKEYNKVVTAVARELIGYAWDIA
ncbi:hypothetical protein [Corallincola spongiicola]|uniref:Transposase n=1 Tax=Corallincola spongiicola TaxID=2520508 RepID=A0ABY1WN97_9GAMM|nr:hypothetical protein [Corallincola spongiicola]TAA45028.1 hypothetical protein EXY25_12530 [Corallincola spongiicola]